MVDRLPHHPRHRPPLTPDLRRDRHVGQPPLLQVVDCTSGHGSQHPPLPPASQRGEQSAGTPGTFSVRMDGASSLRIYTPPPASSATSVPYRPTRSSTSWPG